VAIGSAFAQILTPLALPFLLTNMAAKRTAKIVPVQYIDAVHDDRGYRYAIVPIESLNPDPGNPRIPAQENGLEAILAIVAEDSDGLLTLARSIVKKKGYNPAELLSVTPLPGDKFLVKEGNRRIAARRLLRNPEILKGHVQPNVLAKWHALKKEDAARALPSTAFVVVADDHEDWVDGRHLGPQGGAGLVPWTPQMKARRDVLRHGKTDRATVILEGLKQRDSGTFSDLVPPKRTYTTFQRVVDSTPGCAHLGIDVNDKGQLVLLKGERSVKLLEQLLRDLHGTGVEKVNSRTLHKTEDITAYLTRLDARVDTTPSDEQIILKGEAGAAKKRTLVAKSTGKRADVMKGMLRPQATRPGKLYDELAKARRSDMPNAAIVLTRILLELSIDQYATENGLKTGGDVDADVVERVTEFRKECNLKGVSIPRPISAALDRAANQPPNLTHKLNVVIDALVAVNSMKKRESEAKKRDLKEKDIVELLHDAVHRLETVPSMPRVSHILEVIAPIFNGMETPRP
jgi:hypothetical protein